MFKGYCPMPNQGLWFFALFFCKTRGQTSVSLLPSIKKINDIFLKKLIGCKMAPFFIKWSCKNSILKGYEFRGESSENMHFRVDFVYFSNIFWIFRKIGCKKRAVKNFTGWKKSHREICFKRGRRSFFRKIRGSFFSRPFGWFSPIARFGSPGVAC